MITSRLYQRLYKAGVVTKKEATHNPETGLPNYLNDIAYTVREARKDPNYLDNVTRLYENIRDNKP